MDDTESAVVLDERAAAGRENAAHAYRHTRAAPIQAQDAATAAARAVREVEARKGQSAPVTLENVRIVAEGRPRGTGRLVCEVGRRTITFHPSHMLEGGTVRKIGDIGTLVIPHWAALTLGLA
jgi:hypothetical protein